jgi:HJR/Mrr/RecB family endonuclease
MGRRRRKSNDDTPELVIKGAFGLFLLLALSIGGVTGFAKAFISLASLLFVGVLVLIVVIVGGVAFLLIRKAYRAQNKPDPNPVPSTPLPSSPTLRPLYRKAPEPVAETDWTISSAREALDDLDWYQFEKFCAALLQADGFVVERKGGAHADGGVDMIATKDGVKVLVQCKHWRRWALKEGVVRELLGAMSHFQVKQGALYTLKGWTAPAARFADDNAIALINGDQIAAAALQKLTPAQLSQFLEPDQHLCPKCDAVMIQRSGTFRSFLSCSRFPRCRGKIEFATN